MLDIPDPTEVEAPAEVPALPDDPEKMVGAICPREN